jgi:hypothetical protein
MIEAAVSAVETLVAVVPLPRAHLAALVGVWRILVTCEAPAQEGATGIREGDHQQSPTRRQVP